MMKNDSKKTLWAGMSKRLNLQTIHYFLCLKKNGKVRLKTPSFGRKFPMVAVMYKYKIKVYYCPLKNSTGDY